jgi:hypothetical protein
MTKTDDDFVSELGSAPQRWLSRVLVHSLSEGFRSADDFLEYFSPTEIMESLEADPELRAKMLVEAAGVHERIAKKKSTNSAAEDLRIALDEGICDSEKVLELFPPDTRIEHLDNGRIWAFLTQDEFWLSVSESDLAIKGVQFMLETALDEELITLQDIADGVSFEEIAKRLPREDLEALLVEALNRSRNQDVFDEAALAEAVPLDSLLAHLSLETVWNTVIVDKVAAPAELTGAAASPAADRPKAAPPQAAEAPQPTAAKGKNKRRKKTAVGPASALKSHGAAIPAAKPRPAPAAPPAPVEGASEDVDVDVELARSPQEVEARKRVADKLRNYDRLPPKFESLPTGILLSMESMYAELFQLGSDEEREECIRDSFPNEAQLTQSMLALIELLDPSIDITDPVIRDADVASLIKVVLFEERHRAEQSSPSRGSAPVPPPPGQSPRRGATPPPLPKVGSKSTPPPLPPPARAPRAR